MAGLRILFGHTGGVPWITVVPEGVDRALDLHAVGVVHRRLFAQRGKWFSFC